MNDVSPCLGTAGTLFVSRGLAMHARNFLSRRLTTRRSRPSCRLGFEPLEDRAVPATYIVTTTNDSGTESLREAIDLSNASVGVRDRIAFNIAGTGVHT